MQPDVTNASQPSKRRGIDLGIPSHGQAGRLTYACRLAFQCPRTCCLTTSLLQGYVLSSFCGYHRPDCCRTFPRAPRLRGVQHAGPYPHPQPGFLDSLSPSCGHHPNNWIDRFRGDSVLRHLNLQMGGGLKCGLSTPFFNSFQRASVHGYASVSSAPPS